MAQNLTQPSPSEDEIDIREIVKLILDSKKILISTIIFFTISSFIYSLSLKPEFKTSTILEISYNELSDGSQKSIETPSDLISDLKILLLKNPEGKFSQNLSMNSIEGKLINLETTSSSGDQNENFLTEIINYVEERHSNLTLLTNNQKKDEISRQIKMIESEISFVKAKVLQVNQSKKLSINSNLEMVKSELSFIKATELSNSEDRLAKLTNELPIIDLEIRQLEKIILDDTNNLSLLKENDIMLAERAANSPTLDQVIFNYKTQINALNRKKSSYIQEIKSLNNQLQILENDTFQSDRLFTLEQEKETLENELLKLENVTFQSAELFKLEQEKATLENELQVLMNQPPVNTRVIRNIETNTVKPKTLLTISLGIIIGFITGIFLVFISNFLKRIREVEA